MQRWRGWVWLWWAWWLCGGAAAQPLAPWAPWAGWLDTEGTATVETLAERADWQPFAGWKGWSYGPEPVWLRVPVPATATADAPPWVLVVRPPHLDRVTFYDPTLGVVRRSGDHIPATEDALGSVLFTFEVQALDSPREVFVRLQSSSSRTVHLSLMPLPEAQAYTRRVEWFTGCIWVLSVVFWLWALVQWWLTRDRLMGIFTIKQGVIVLWGFLFLGFGRLVLGPLFPPGVLSLISSMVVGAVVASSAWFLSALLQEHPVRPWMLKGLQAAAMGVVGITGLNLFGYTQQALHLINAMAPGLLLWAVLTLVAARRAHPEPPLSKRVLLIYLIAYATLNALPSLTYVGLIGETAILFLGNMGLLVLDGLIMLVMLYVRQRRFRHQHETLRTQLLLQKEQARLDQQYLADQRQLLAMLAHEMKTPLANLRLWMEAGPQGRQVMERAIRDMDRVIERCVHTGQLSDQRLRPSPEWLDGADLTQGLVGLSRQPERVRLQLPADECPLHTDPQMLSIVLSNVLENAYKYSPAASDIALALCPHTHDGRAGWHWTIENAVGDAGHPEADKVFDKYYRGPHAQRKSGSGLGLFLVKSLLELMGGHVAYTALPDRVRFVLWLPVQHEAAD
jgi:two-component system, sensor histidine kinase LadS